MINRRKLAMQAIKNATKVRRATGVPLTAPVCVYDIAHKLGLEVKFVDVPSLEGLYVKGNPSGIMISSHRPSGRQRVTCGHEIGHHVFGHGSRVDEYLGANAMGREWTAEEWLANSFGAFLIMSKYAVLESFEKRGWETSVPSAVQVYTVACELGTSYRGLIQHMRWSLGLIEPSGTDELLTCTPKGIRTLLCGDPRQGELIVVDKNWYQDKAADAQIGDAVLLPHNCHAEGKRLRLLKETSYGILYEAVSQGIEQVRLPGSSWGVFVRVSPRAYVGRAIFRHLENDDDDS